MKRYSLKGIMVAVMLLSLLVVASAGAQANAIDAAKAANQIGERYDGYLGVVDARASDDIKALVTETNAGRKEKYEEIARRNSIPAGQVGRIAGAKLMKKASPGQHIMPREGEWLVK